jgi:type IV secretory pathway TrbF-like protein
MTHESQLALNRSLVVPPDHPGEPYLEISATYAVHNRYLRIALAVAVLVIAMFSIAGWRLAQAWADRKPLVVRINQDGDAMVAPFASLDYRPREPEIRYFLNRFVVEHYGRTRATAKDAFQRKLYFLSGELARSTMEQEQRTQEIQNFLVSGTEEADVYATNVTIEDLRQPPYKARVNFDKVFHAIGTTRELRRESYTAQMQFTLLDKVPNNFITTNPLGLVITYLRSDQAFDRPAAPAESARGSF